MLFLSGLVPVYNLYLYTLCPRKVHSHRVILTDNSVKGFPDNIPTDTYVKIFPYVPIKTATCFCSSLLGFYYQSWINGRMYIMIFIPVEFLVLTNHSSLIRTYVCSNVKYGYDKKLWFTYKNFAAKFLNQTMGTSCSA